MCHSCVTRVCACAVDGMGLRRSSVRGGLDVKKWERECGRATALQEFATDTLLVCAAAEAEEAVNSDEVLPPAPCPVCHSLQVGLHARPSMAGATWE